MSSLFDSAFLINLLDDSARQVLKELNVSASSCTFSKLSLILRRRPQPSAMKNASPLIRACFIFPADFFFYGFHVHFFSPNVTEAFFSVVVFFPRRFQGHAAALLLKRSEIAKQLFWIRFHDIRWSAVKKKNLKEQYQREE